ncbi:hypothetical protein IAQ61_010375 [Plenodomus lingam]|uniref:uncharacterized protein n=1 Tax=Leptosphaeria maculans TaxID=5022 RepID=UPI003334A3AC|nr:hypothetical protein IAQ61_010375 [Plenodomus lingam]
MFCTKQAVWRWHNRELVSEEPVQVARSGKISHDQSNTWIRDEACEKSSLRSVAKHKSSLIHARHGFFQLNVSGQSATYVAYSLATSRMFGTSIRTANWTAWRCEHGLTCTDVVVASPLKRKNPRRMSCENSTPRNVLWTSFLHVSSALKTKSESISDQTYLCSR